MTTEFEDYIRKWILEDLSKPVGLLNNLPKCPFAKKALLDEKVKFYTAAGDLNYVVKEITKHWNDEKIEVAVIHLNWDVKTKEMEGIVNVYNKLYEPKDFLLLDDHIDVEEKIEDVDFSNGRYNILLLQKKSKIVSARTQLEKLNYYKNWPEEYYNQVVF